MSLTDPQKRDFIAQMIELLLNSSESLTEKGFDPKSKIDSLTSLSTEADKAEAQQQQAQADSKKATGVAREKLNAAYEDASASVDLVSGLLGKDNEFVQQLRKIRK